MNIMEKISQIRSCIDHHSLSFTIKLYVHININSYLAKGGCYTTRFSDF